MERSGAAGAEAPVITTSPLLLEAGIRHGFTTRRGGVSSGRFASLNLGASFGDRAHDVLENFRRVARAGGFPIEALCQVIQVHGTEVLHLVAAERRLREADGMVTSAALTLAVSSADCVCILLGDGEGRVAAAHAGWRGTAGGMAGRLVEAMVREGAQRERIRAALGPSIGPCCFEVREDVAAPFARLVPESVRGRAGRLYVDLRLANQVLLARAGVLPEHIDWSPPCTACREEEYFSYRRDGAAGGVGQHLAFILGGTP